MKNKSNAKALRDLITSMSEKRAEGLCPACNKVIVPEEFRNDISRTEFRISGLCQQCQDKVFGVD